MDESHERRTLADELATAFLAGRWTAEQVAERGAGCLDRWPDWISALALRAVAAHRSPPADRRDELVALIEEFLAERPGPPGGSAAPRIVRLFTRERSSSPAPRWPVAEIDSVAELADRLELSHGQLAWLADVRGMERTVAAGKLRNYRYRAVPRQGGLPRVIESPKARLKEIQRWLLREILDHIPPHDAAHGFTRGRSVVSNARLHTGQHAVLRLDLKDFFASIAAARVCAIFRAAGYGRGVAHVLTGLSTNTIPLSVWSEIGSAGDARLVGPHFWLGRQLATPHLPQGAPTSPALANLAAFGLDRRLAGLAGSWGLRYSRYADDLAFSGPSTLRDGHGQLSDVVAAIARQEGFAINPAKKVLRTSAVRQTLCGVVVNVRPNPTRAEYDRVKAILHNVARHGPQGQNRSGVADLQAHLRGRVAWIASVNPERGEKLRRRFADIDWSRP